MLNEKSTKKESTRMRCKLKIQVHSISIDLSTAASSSSTSEDFSSLTSSGTGNNLPPTGTLSLTGRISQENSYASVISFHSLHLWGVLPLKLYEYPWHALTLRRLGSIAI